MTKAPIPALFAPGSVAHIPAGRGGIYCTQENSAHSWWRPIIEEEKNLGVVNCPCAELLAGIAPGVAIQVIYSSDPVTGYLVGAVSPNTMQIENLGQLINLCCNRLIQVTRLNVVPLAYVPLQSSNDVAVINTNTNTVIDTISVGNSPATLPLLPMRERLMWSIMEEIQSRLSIR